MPSVKIVLKLLCQDVDSGHQCQVNLRRSIYEIDTDIEEIKLPLQAIVKLKRIQQASDLHSTSMLPIHQRAQISLPVISRLAPSDERPGEVPIRDGRGSRRFDDEGRRSTVVRVRKPSTKQADIKSSRSKEELKEIKAMLLELKETLMAKESVTPTLMDDEEEQSDERVPWRTSSVVRRISEGLKEIRASETTNCPFVQYILAKHDAPEGNIDTSLPISAIIGTNYSMSYKHEGTVEPEPKEDSNSVSAGHEHVLSSDSEYPKSTRDDTATETSAIDSAIGVLSNESNLKDTNYSLQQCPPNDECELNSLDSSKLEK